MTAVSETNSSLTTQCLDFCQALAGQGKVFKFSITIDSTFTFSLDTRVGKGDLPHKDQEEEQPINDQKKCQAQRGIPQEVPI